MHCRQRVRSEDTLDSVCGDNVGEVVGAVIADDQKKIIADLQAELAAVQANLRTKEEDLAEATLTINMKREEIESQEAMIASLRGEKPDPVWDICIVLDTYGFVVSGSERS